jgi:hypothetical protein
VRLPAAAPSVNQPLTVYQAAFFVHAPRTALDITQYVQGSR